MAKPCINEWGLLVSDVLCLNVWIKKDYILDDTFKKHILKAVYF